MNKVYVLEQGCKYEGGGVVAVYGFYVVARADLEALVREEDEDTKEMREFEREEGHPESETMFTFMEETSQDFFVNHSNYICLSEREVHLQRRIDG